MNAGAYGGEMKDVVRITNALKPGTGSYALTGEENRFAYRYSRFCDSGSGDVILSSVIRLHDGDKESIKAKMDDLAAKRRESQPLDLPSAGSVFKRPKEGYAAALIEQAGLKGLTVGGAQVSEKHAGFIVNRANASFNDVISLIEHVKETVYVEFGTRLELELKVIQ